MQRERERESIDYTSNRASKLHTQIASLAYPSFAYPSGTVSKVDMKRESLG
jgi:hypothetical protein